VKTPGTLKTCSISTRFVTTIGIVTPVSENTGATAAGTAWRRMTLCGRTPFARAVRR
jgi:hypothetical protein